MKARAVALNPPATSRTTPRSHVNKDTSVSLEPEMQAIMLTAHRPENDQSGGDDVPAVREWLVGEESIVDDLSADVVF